MAYGILIQNKVATQNVDAFNRPAVAASNVENGSVFNLLTLSSIPGEGEVWTATAPVTGALSNLWMAYEPEVVTTVSGSSEFKGIDPDPRNFINIAGKVFSCFKPQVGDIMRISADGVAGTKSTNEYVVATNNAWKLTWAASAVSGLSLKLIRTSYISIGTGSIGTQRVTAYDFEVVAVE